MSKKDEPLVQKNKEKRIKNGALQCKDPHLTRQEFADEANINRVLDRVANGIAVSHLQRHGGSYGDFADWDENTYEDLRNDLAEALTIFNELPSELRSVEFDNNPGKFFAYVNDPANAGDLAERMPQLLEPGRQLPTVTGARPVNENAIPAPEPTPEPAPEPTPEA